MAQAGAGRAEKLGAVPPVGGTLLITGWVWAAWIHWHGAVG